MSEEKFNPYKEKIRSLRQCPYCKNRDTDEIVNNDRIPYTNYWKERGKENEFSVRHCSACSAIFHYLVPKEKAFYNN